MAFFFGDGFDLYSTITDCGTYWDAGFGVGVNLALSSNGRFAGSRGVISIGTNAAPYITKTSNVNDAVHHISLAWSQANLGGTTQIPFFVTFYDGATAQCTLGIRGDGGITLLSGGSGGSALATYAGAVTAINTWYQFECEIVINSTTGSLAVRKNGNTSNDFFLGSLNTRGGTANNYANKIGVGAAWSTSGHSFDDFLWRSDASSVPWIGDVRCYTRMPAADSAVQWSRSGSVVPLTPFAANSAAGFAAANSYFTPFTAPCNGTVGTLSLNFTVAATANFKCSIYSSSGTQPTTVLGSATIVTNPGIGAATFTFGTPVTVVQGTQYWIGWHADAASGTASITTAGTAGWISTVTSYASFPVSNPPSLTGGNAFTPTVTITPTATNAPFVADIQQDAATTYVYSSTNGQADLYTIAPLTQTPTTIIGTTVRGYFQKSDAGTRNATVQVKSGSTTVQGTSIALPAGSWQWIARTDLTDPNTSAAWTPAAVNALLIGEVVTA